MTKVLKTPFQYALLLNGICSFYHLEFNSGYKALADPEPETGLLLQKLSFCSFYRHHEAYATALWASALIQKMGGGGGGRGRGRGREWVFLVPPHGSTNEKRYRLRRQYMDVKVGWAILRSYYKREQSCFAGNQTGDKDFTIIF